MRPFPLCVLPLLVACGSPDVEGTWVGDCALESGTMSSVMTITLELDPAEGDAVTGVGSLLDQSYDASTPVTVEGTLDGRDVALELVMDLEMPTFSTTTTTTTSGLDGALFGDLGISYGVEGKIKGDVLEGQCSLTVMGFGIHGDIEMQRQ